MRQVDQQILQQLHDLREARQSTDHERGWMIAHLKNDHLQKILPKISIVGLHMLSALLGKPLTGIELANRLQVTRGGITRAAKGLLNLDLIVSFKQADDRKKVFYRLTAEGEELAVCHQQMHEIMNQRFVRAIGERYSEQELKLCSRFLADVSKLEQRLDE